MDPATRGSLLHDALARFFARARERVGGPVFLRAADRDWALPLVREALEAAIADAKDRAWLGHELLVPAKTAELSRMLRRFIEWEIEEHEDMYNPRARNAPRRVRTAVIAHELKFDEVILERNGVRFRFRGSVDRVEQGIDDRFPEAHIYLAAVDYKTTAWSVPGAGKAPAWTDRVVLQVPLYAHALERLHPGKTSARIEYRAVKSREALHTLELFQYDKKTGRLVENTEHREKMEAALDAVAEHVSRARRGEFPADPAPSCNCPPYCHALEICRVKGGPRLGKRS